MALREHSEADNLLYHSPNTTDLPNTHMHETIMSTSDRRPSRITSGSISHFRRKCGKRRSGCDTAVEGTVDATSFTRRSTSSQVSSGQQKIEDSITPEGLAAWLKPSEFHRYGIQEKSIRLLWSASPEPPVTKASLCELDLPRIINDARLRHDLNFEREVAFRPNLYGSQGSQKVLLAQEYWEALVVEFAISISRNLRRLKVESEIKPPWLLSTSQIRSVPWRLPRLFQTIHDVLKTLVPESEWLVVDQRLDVELLMQEMDKGVCDIGGLSSWLGKILLGSCSPVRDPLVHSMVLAIQQGAEQDDARMLVNGLGDLFGVLEIMKLDVANHQIRYLRLLMVDDTIDFEQRYALRSIANGTNLSDAIEWYKAASLKGESQNFFDKPKAAIFLRALVDLITGFNTKCPLTFAFDYERLRSLNMDFGSCYCQSVCTNVFKRALTHHGWVRAPSWDARVKLSKRITSIVKSEKRPYRWLASIGGVALEIAREVYRLCSINGLPTEDHLERIATELHEGFTSYSTPYEDLEDRLEELVWEEYRDIEVMTPLQILSYMHPESPIEAPADDQDDLVNIARRIAHIGLLHWRVWAPILYEQPRAYHSLMPSAPAEPTLANAESRITGMASFREEGRREPRREVNMRHDPGIANDTGEDPELAAAMQDSCCLSDQRSESEG